MQQNDTQRKTPNLILSLAERLRQCAKHNENAHIARVPEAALTPESHQNGDIYGDSGGSHGTN